MVDLEPDDLLDDDEGSKGSSLLEPENLEQLNKLLESDVAKGMARQFGLMPQAQQGSQQGGAQSGGDGGVQVDAEQVYTMITTATGRIADSDPDARIEDVYQQIENNPEQIKKMINNVI